jgi:hypothetical protein
MLRALPIALHDPDPDMGVEDYEAGLRSDGNT